MLKHYFIIIIYIYLFFKLILFICNFCYFLFKIKSGLTPLHLAVTKGNARIVKKLLQKGANPNLKDC